MTNLVQKWNTPTAHTITAMVSMSMTTVGVSKASLQQIFQLKDKLLQLLTKVIGSYTGTVIFQNDVVVPQRANIKTWIFVCMFCRMIGRCSHILTCLMVCMLSGVILLSLNSSKLSAAPKSCIFNYIL